MKTGDEGEGRTGDEGLRCRSEEYSRAIVCLAVFSMDFPTEQRIRFLAEREWRLLENIKQKDLWKQCSDGWLWYQPQLGRELQLVILPDNRTLSMAIECSKIREALIVKNRPPVQLITADAIKKI